MKRKQVLPFENLFIVSYKLMRCEARLLRILFADQCFAGISWDSKYETLKDTTYRHF